LSKATSYGCWFTAILQLFSHLNPELITATVQEFLSNKKPVKSKPVIPVPEQIPESAAAFLW